MTCIEFLSRGTLAMCEKRSWARITAMSICIIIFASLFRPPFKNVLHGVVKNGLLLMAKPRSFPGEARGNKVLLPWLKANKVRLPWLKANKVRLPWLKANKVRLPWLKTNKARLPWLKANSQGAPIKGEQKQAALIKGEQSPVALIKGEKSCCLD